MAPEIDPRTAVLVRRLGVLIPLVVAAAACTAQSSGFAATENPDLPRDPRQDVEPQTAKQSEPIPHRRYHGQSVPEPYAWLEAMDSDSVLEWAKQQDRQARTFLRDEDTGALADTIRAAAEVQRFMPPLRRKDRYFFVTFDGAATRASAWMQIGLKGKPRRLIAEEELAAQGKVLHRQIWPSPDGRMVAYGVAPSGSRWMELRIRDVQTGRDQSDRLTGLVASSSTVSWSKDGKSLFYERFEEPPADARLHASLRDENVLAHSLGTPQADDVLVFENRDPDHQLLGHALSDDGRFLVVTARDDRETRTRVMVLDTRAPKSGFLDLTRGIEAAFSFVGSRGDEIWLQTDLRAPRGRIVAVDVRRPDPESWRIIVPEHPHATIDTFVGASALGLGVVVGYREDSRLRFDYFDRNGAFLRRFEPPNFGSVWTGFVGHQGADEVFFTVSSFADPGTVFRFDLHEGEQSIFRRPRLPYDPSEIVVEQRFYRNDDGTRAPMFIAYHRDTPPNGERPIMMYGYGFGGWIAAPWFRPHLWQWFRSGGAFALPGLRGGGEYGEQWHQSGAKTRKKNAIRDYISAARWLVDQRLVEPARLVAETNSAGGPVVGAAVLAQPQLFGAAILSFPLLDVLGYERYTHGGRWRSELGSVANRDEFFAMRAYSPVHNVREGVCYPPTMVAPGSLDEITPPVHAYKFTAALQDAQACDRPVLMRVSREAGHAYGRNATKTAESLAAQLLFLEKVLPEVGAP